MSNFKTVAYLTPGHELYEIFPDGEVPVVSFCPQYIDGCPEPFFLVNGSLLFDSQVKPLSDYAVRLFPDLFRDGKDAEAFVIQGFPLLFRDFCGGRTDDLSIMLATLEAMWEEVENHENLEEDGELDR
jgi:hypothetical protein